MYSNALRIYLWMTSPVPYHAPLRPVHLSFVYVTAHEKVPETKKGDDGVLLLRRGALMKYTVPYRTSYKLGKNITNPGT